MITDLWFYLAALPIIFLVGLSKGGFLTGLGVLGVPLLSLIMPPREAAGLLLPILSAMDLVGVWSYRRSFDKSHLLALLPGALAGTAIGWGTARYVSDAHIEILVGTIGLSYLLYTQVLKARAIPSSPPSFAIGNLLGVAAGFTSFISHAGGPPVQIYLQPQKLAPALFAGTTVMCFAAINAVKLVPFVSLGLITGASMRTDLVLLPVAIVAALSGVWLAKRVPQEPFYVVANICLAVVSAELIREGFTTLLAR